MDWVFPLSQALLVASLAGWIITGVVDNMLYPKINRDVVAMVMRLELLEQEWPKEFAQVAHRRVESDAVITWAFRALVAWEALASLLLTLGAIALLMGTVGTADLDWARGFASLGVIVFTLTWAGFLVGGNYFCYWYCHFAPQVTHFMLAIWGSVTLVYLNI